MKVIFTVLLIIAASGCANNTDLRKESSSRASFERILYLTNFELQLSSEQTVFVEKYVVLYAGGDDTWILAIQYTANDLKDISKLCSTAKLIWPHLKPYVEERGWRWGGVRAAQKIETIDYGSITKGQTAIYSISFEKVESNWEIRSVNNVCGSS